MKEIFAACVRELWLAREYLTRQKGQRKDSSASYYIDYTWKDYCRDAGIPYGAANCWTKKFIPREVSPDGQDHCLGSVPPGFAAAVWWLNKGRKKTIKAAIGGREIEAAGQRRRA